MSKQFITSVSRAITVGFAGLCFSALLPQTAFAGDFSATEDFSVALNKTQIMRLPAPAAAIIVGNPAIADVSVHSPTLLFVLGRGYGVTNVIILDDMGNTILNTDIQVGNNQSGSGKRLMLAGKGWQSYSCTPFCQPAPVLGDNPKFVANFKGKDKPIDNTGTPISASPFSSGGFSDGVLNSTFPTSQNAQSQTQSFAAPEVQKMQTPMPINAASGRAARH